MPDPKQGSQGGQGSMNPEETGRGKGKEGGMGNIPKNPERSNDPRRSGQQTPGDQSGSHSDR